MLVRVNTDQQIIIIFFNTYIKIVPEEEEPVAVSLKECLTLKQMPLGSSEVTVLGSVQKMSGCSKFFVYSLVGMVVLGRKLGLMTLEVFYNLNGYVISLVQLVINPRLIQIACGIMFKL